MNPDSETGAWLALCLGIEAQQTDIEAAGIHLEVENDD